MSFFSSLISKSFSSFSGKLLSTPAASWSGVRCISGADQSVFNHKSKFQVRNRKIKKDLVFGNNAFQGKPIQEWKDWDGFGPYKYIKHDYPNNITNRDVQRRRILKKFGIERLRTNVVRFGDMLPKVSREPFNRHYVCLSWASLIVRLGIGAPSRRRNPQDPP